LEWHGMITEQKKEKEIINTLWIEKQKIQMKDAGDEVPPFEEQNWRHGRIKTVFTCEECTIEIRSRNYTINIHYKEGNMMICNNKGSQNIE